MDNDGWHEYLKIKKNEEYVARGACAKNVRHAADGQSVGARPDDADA